MSAPSEPPESGEAGRAPPPRAQLSLGDPESLCRAGQRQGGRRLQSREALFWGADRLPLVLRSQALPQATLSRVCRSVSEYEKVIVLRQSKPESRFRVLATVSPRFPGNVKLFGWGSVVLRPRHQDRGSPVERGSPQHRGSFGPVSCALECKSLPE